MHFKSEIPLFTKQLAIGLGLAEEPDQKFAVQESFGMNRCQIVANGLLEAWYQGDDLPEVRMQAILGQFSHLGIELQRPYVNVLVTFAIVNSFLDRSKRKVPIICGVVA